MEVERLGRHIAHRRPGIVTLPGIRSRTEGHGLGQVERAFILEPIRKPRRLDLLAEQYGRVGAELDRAQTVAVASCPATVVPGADDEIVDPLGVVLLQRVVDRQRTVEIFLVPPAGHRKRRYGHRLAGKHGAHLPAAPVFVEVRVGGKVGPGRTLLVKVLGVNVGKTAQPEEPFEGIGPIEAKRFADPSGLEVGDVLEPVAQTEGAVVAEIVALEHVVGRCLR